MCIRDSIILFRCGRRDKLRWQRADSARGSYARGSYTSHASGMPPCDCASAGHRAVVRARSCRPRNACPALSVDDEGSGVREVVDNGAWCTQTTGAPARLGTAIDEHRAATGANTGFDVVEHVTDHPRLVERDALCCRRFEQKPGARLAARTRDGADHARAGRMMRAPPVT